MQYMAEELLQREPYKYDERDKNQQSLFYNSLLEELKFHYENNEKYKTFCINKNFDPLTFQGKLEEIPPIQVSVFKDMGTQLTSVSNEDIKMTLQSSATSGRPSNIRVDKITTRRQAKAMVKVVGDFIGNERRKFLIMDVNPAEGFREILGARYAAVSGYLNFASEVEYFLKVNSKKEYYYDIDFIENFVEKLNKNEPVVVFGFTYILFSEVILPLFQNNKKFSLPKGSKVIHIGGWKKLESEKVSKEVFNDTVSSVLGVDISDIIDIYGFTEQMGLNYPDCEYGYKHCSIYSDVIVRDVVTKETLGYNKEGLLEFVTPIPHSYPGNVVLTDDIGVLEEGICNCGRCGKRFRVIGRLKKAEVRGCGDILSNKLKFVNSADTKVKENSDGKCIVSMYNGDKEIRGVDGEDIIRLISIDLRSRLKWLRQQPVDALIGLIAQVAKKWKSASYSEDVLGKLKANGLDFLAGWCTDEHLNQIVSEGMGGNRFCLDSFQRVTDMNTIQARKAVSRGLVCHWLAGNVQVLGMFVLIESILTKNVNLIKISSRNENVLETLLEGFIDEEFVTRGGYVIKGNDLLKTIAVIYFSHKEAKLGQEMSQNADVRVAWGGKEAVETVAAYPVKYDCVDIIMGPKLSFSVISKEEIADEHKAKKCARKVAVDASVFDQTGCASTHNVYVETGGEITAKKFAELLSESMRKTAIQIPGGNIEPELIANIHSIRGVYDFKGVVWGDNDNKWSVLYSDELELHAPVYGRTVFVNPINLLDDVLPFISDDIQTIGLAAQGDKALEFASRAAELGVARLPVCGRMLNFDSPWDGMYIMDRLVRWTTLGGPVV